MTPAPFCVCLLVIGLLDLSDCYKVIVLFPFPGKSHSILGEGYVNILLRDGHEVTYVTPFPCKKPAENLTQVDLSSLLVKNPLPFNISFVLDNNVEMMNYDFVLNFMQSTAKNVILHDKIQTLLNDRRNNFDVVIAEWMFSELYSGFANVFNCPLIWSSSMELHWQILELLGEPVSPAIVPDPLANSIPPYSLWERIEALWSMAKIKFMKFRKFSPIDSQLYKEAFGTASSARGVKLLTFEEMRLNASLVLGNSHMASGQAMTLPASYIPIGGYHIFGEEEEMSTELQAIMDSSPQGVIYFSMGSILKSKEMPQEMKEELIEVFGNLKQTVLWKMEDNMTGLPRNVHTLKWAPQRSILNHPHTVIFISHGGLLSTTEALHYGVPLIGIPAFGDQFPNIARAVRKGFGVEVPLSLQLASALQVAIRKVLDDERYSKSARFLSWVFKSGGSSADALTRAVRLAVEGRSMLRPPVLPLYQVFYLDVAALFIAALLVMMWVLRICVRRLKGSGGKQKAL